jgi:hypothetical protein
MDLPGLEGKEGLLEDVKDLFLKDSNVLLSEFFCQRSQD